MRVARPPGRPKPGAIRTLHVRRLLLHGSKLVHLRPRVFLPIGAPPLLHADVRAGEHTRANVDIVARSVYRRAVCYMPCYVRPSKA